MTVEQGTQPDGQGERKREEDKKRGGIFWFYRRYQDYDKWTGRWDWLNWAFAFFKTNTAVIVAGTGAAAVTVGTVVVVTNPELKDRWFPKAPPAIEAPAPVAEKTVVTQNWGSSVIFPIEGKDLAGKRAAFDVAVLPKDLSWAHKSSNELTQGGQTIAEADVPPRIFTAELRAGLARSGAVMAVGLASQEGQRPEEIERARLRANTGAVWLAAAVDQKTPIWVLNLGQFQGGCKAVAQAPDTSWQRPLIVVGIREQEDAVKIDEAFANAISGKTNLPSRDCYTNFDLTRHR